MAEAGEGGLPGVPVSRSSGVVAEFREYERTATTVLNAYLAPETGSVPGAPRRPRRSPPGYPATSW